MKRDVIFSGDAREGLKQGIDILSDAVKSTLGPKGRIVTFYNKYTGIHSTKDGVSVANEIELEDELQMMGVRMIREAASKTNDLAGDGTTTATVLAQAMVKEGLKNVAAGANPMDLKRGMDTAFQIILNKLSTFKQDVDFSSDKIEQVATISANNDKSIGELISKAYERIGKDGVLTIEESRNAITSIDVVQGMQFNRGYLSPYFVTDTDSMQILYDNIQILIYDNKIETIEELSLVEEYSIDNNQPILIICDDMTKEVLANLVLKKLRKESKIFVIKSPYFGLKRKESLQDISVLTGAYILSKEKGVKLSNFTSKMLGSAEKCIINLDTTIIVNGHGKDSDVKEYITNLKSSRDSLDSTKEKTRLDERVAKLAGGVAVLYVGAASEVEMKEKVDRAVDAKAATEAALEEGIVAGGGVALLRASQNISPETDNFDQITGVNIVLEACKSPILQIAKNSGISGEVIIDKILSSKDNFYGYNFKDNIFNNMLEEGIIDPKKVTRIALESAISVAGIIIMTECVLVNKQEQENGLPEFLNSPG